MEQKNNKKIIIIIMVLIIAIAIPLVYLGIKNSKKETQPKIENETNNTSTKNEEKVDDGKTEETEYISGEELENNNYVYGYVAIYNDNISKILELNTNSNNKELASIKGRIYYFRIRNNKIYYSVQDDNKETASYIDLNTENKKSVELISGKDVVEYGFDSNNKYLFTPTIPSGITRYDLSTKKSTTYFQDEIRATEVFIADNKIYITGQKKTDKYSVSSDSYYYTASIDGNDLKEISKSAYDDKNIETGISSGIAEYDKQFLIYKNKTVNLSNDLTQVLYDDEVIYTATSNRKLILLYSQNNNTIAFMEYNNNDDSLTSTKYYTYDINTKNLKETTKESTYEFSIVPLSNE